MTNIFDVAKKANVSKSTVSRVFSGSRHVSEKSRQKSLPLLMNWAMYLIY
ncbi:hypothetical protein NBRC111452_785 [Companilactobacillus farciminis]|nr:hypothetical protein NBRC111452_785 [Companilactobacillus farciminis]